MIYVSFLGRDHATGTAASTPVYQSAASARTADLATRDLAERPEHPQVVEDAVEVLPPVFSAGKHPIAHL